MFIHLSIYGFYVASLQYKFSWALPTWTWATRKVLSSLH